MPDALLDGALERYPRRLLSTSHARVSLTVPASSQTQVTGFVDGAGAAGGDPIESIVVESGNYPRVVTELPSGARLLLYVHPDDAVPTVSAPTLLSEAPSHDATEAGIGPIAYPGLALHILESTDRHAHVEWNDGTLRAEGWLLRSSLARVFRSVTVPEIPQKAFELGKDSGILTAPRGEVIAQMLGTHPLAAEILEPAKSGYVKLLARAERTTSLREHRIAYEIRGFVPEAALGASMSNTESGAAALPSRATAETGRVAHGTRLYDQPNGSVVGVAVGEMSARFGESRPNGWQSLLVSTAWSNVTVWMQR